MKLILHQHSLLTRKVFSRHNLSTQVFFSLSSESSSSSRHLHLQVIFIFKSSSSLGHHHLHVIFISGFGSSLDLDHHHSIWIITWSESSLDHHLWIWIIPLSRSSLLDHHHKCYLFILLVTGISTEPALFHASCRPSLHVGLLQHLYLTLS